MIVLTSLRMSFTSLIWMRSPFCNSTMGPSIWSQGVPMVPFPGRSVFIWVPTVMKLSRMNMVAGLIAVEASPAVRARPYLRRNPPFREGWDSTGLPAMTSPMYLDDGGIIGISPFSLVGSTPLLTKGSRNSHPGSFIFLICLLIFGALRQRPSAMTRQAPPRKRLVPTLGRSRYPATSSSSVASPLMQIGQFFMIRSISSTEGRYCRCCTRLYKGISSLSRSISPCVAM